MAFLTGAGRTVNMTGTIGGTVQANAHAVTGAGAIGLTNNAHAEGSLSSAASAATIAVTHTNNTTGTQRTAHIEVGCSDGTSVVADVVTNSVSLTGSFSSSYTVETCFEFVSMGTNPHYLGVPDAPVLTAIRIYERLVYGDRKSVV